MVLWKARALLAGGALAAAALGLWGVYAAGHANGRAQVQAEWDRAKAGAQSKQSEQVANAADEFARQVEVIRTVYRDRVKEVKVYVPEANSCPADDTFIRLFNCTR